MREIKFRGWDGREMHRVFYVTDKGIGSLGNGGMIIPKGDNSHALMQYTGLKDSNGLGLTELYEGDILSENGVIVGSIYEVQQRETDLVIPCIRSKDWLSAYQEAVARGFDYAK